MGYVGVYDPSSGFEWSSDDVAWFIRKVQEWLELKKRSDELIRRMELYEREKKRLEELARRGVISEDELAIRLREAWTRIVKKGHYTETEPKVVRVRVREEKIGADAIPEGQGLLVLPYRVPTLVVNVVKFAPMMLIISETCYDPRCEPAGLDFVDRGYVTDVVFPRLYEYIIGKTVLENTIPIFRLGRKHLGYKMVHGRHRIVLPPQQVGEQKHELAEEQKDAQPKVVTVENPDVKKVVTYVHIPEDYRDFPDLYLLHYYRELTITKFVSMLELAYSLGSVAKYVINDRFGLSKILVTLSKNQLLLDYVARTMLYLAQTCFPATTFVLFQSIEDPQRGIFLDLKRCVDYPRELTSIEHVREIVVYGTEVFKVIIFRVANADHLLLSNLFTLLNEENYTSIDPNIVKKLCLTKHLGVRTRTMLR